MFPGVYSRPMPSPADQTSAAKRTCDVAMLLVALAVAALHPLAWARHPPDVDSIDLTVALHRFSIAQDAPDPPGYALYVLAARLAAPLFGDAHAYQAVNLLLLLGTGLCLYLTLRRFNAPVVGALAALLFMTHPLAFAATVIPEPFIAEALFAALVACSVARACVPTGVRAAQTAALFAALGLINPLTGLLLLPLLIGGTALFQTDHRRSGAALTGLAGALALAAALGAMIWQAGGPDRYARAVAHFTGDAFRTSSVLAGAPIAEHARMVAKLGAWLLLFAGPGLVASAAAMLVHRRHRPPRTALTLLALWTAPTLAYFALFHYSAPASQLVYLPCLLLPLAWGLHVLSEGLRPLAPIAAGLIAVAQLLFFFVPQRSEPLPLFRLTRGYLALQDREFDRVEDVLRRLPRDDTLALFAGHPTLSMYALRLMERDAGSGIVNDDDRTASYFDPETLDWAPSTNHDDTIDARFKRVVVIHQAAGRGAVDVVELAPDQSRFIPDVLARAAQASASPP